MEALDVNCKGMVLHRLMTEKKSYGGQAPTPDTYPDKGCKIEYRFTKCLECPFPLTDNGDCIMDAGLKNYIAYFRNKAVLYDHYMKGVSRKGLQDKYNLSEDMVGKIVSDTDRGD